MPTDPDVDLALWLIHQAFLEIRHDAERADPRRAHQFADAFHNLPNALTSTSRVTPVQGLAHLRRECETCGLADWYDHTVARRPKPKTD